MKTYILYIIAVLTALLATACGHSDSFRVHGELTDGSSINLRVVYYTNGSVITGITASNAGKFMYEGQAAKPALVELYDNDYRLLGRLIARNGEDIEVKLDRTNPYRISIDGNDTGEALAAYLSANADDLQSASIAGRNRLIAARVKAEPASPVSYLLLVTEFSTPGYEQLADSLLSLIPEEARIEGVSAGFEAMLRRVADGVADDKVMPVPYMVSGGRTRMFRPSDTPLSLIILSDARTSGDSVLNVMRDLSRHERKGRFDILDLNLDQDTMVWRRTVRNDSATWTQGWAAGGISARGVDRLGVSALPCFVLVDSAGRRLWYGSSAAIAKSQTLKYLK